MNSGNPLLGSSQLTMSSALVKEIEDELVPPDERGRELSPYLSPDSFVKGVASLTKKDYEACCGPGASACPHQPVI